MKAFEAPCFILSNNLLAQRNSVARIASPAGITTIAGPGNTVMASPEKYGETDDDLYHTLSLLKCLNHTKQFQIPQTFMSMIDTKGYENSRGVSPWMSGKMPDLFSPNTSNTHNVSKTTSSPPFLKGDVGGLQTSI